ncbi:MAG: NAD(P)-dependent glycerol-3-phosphate dehydrogenase [Candidatus Sumerlaeia bacterium]|nr:NAD(P)-dependent glycerol-3-phosphate dehydrogenase [Candidatus Sumerlaeia bacterium]
MAPEATRIAVLGAGAWGSTFADLLARKGHAVTLWDIRAEALERLAHERHPFGVPELRLAESVRLQADLATAVADAEVIVFVIPSQATAELAARLSGPTAGRSPLVVLASKGLDIPTSSPLSDVIRRALPHCRVGVVSGPCIAREVAQGVPTSVVAASDRPEDARFLRDLVATPALRAYTQHDVLGVELGGALKNVIAIAAGVGDGLGFGANTKSALLTRGLAEMSRLATALGAEGVTLFGLAGLGDLAVTCFSPHSRNRTFGEHLGRGLTPAAAREAIGMVVEGEPTARAARDLARRQGLEMPITEVVVGLCDGVLSARDAVVALMQRELKDEFPGE